METDARSGGGEEAVAEYAKHEECRRTRSTEPSLEGWTGVGRLGG